MALKPCPECGAPVSTGAFECPRCGFNPTLVALRRDEQAAGCRRSLNQGCGCVFWTIVLLGASYYFWPGIWFHNGQGPPRPAPLIAPAPAVPAPTTPVPVFAPTPPPEPVKPVEPTAPAIAPAVEEEPDVAHDVIRGLDQAQRRRIYATICINEEEAAEYVNERNPLPARDDERYVVALRELDALHLAARTTVRRAILKAFKIDRAQYEAISREGAERKWPVK